MTELLLDLVTAQAEQLEDPELDVAAMDTDRAGRHFIAIADHVICVRKDLGRVGLEFRQILQLRHGERMVLRIPLLVPLRSRRTLGSPPPRRTPSHSGRPDSTVAEDQPQSA